MSNPEQNKSRSLIFATAGHVDHGKTSLVANLTGVDTDTLAEEKNRGLTIVPGYAYHHFESSDDGETVQNTLGFVDVPGHIDFINNMLAGVGAVDAALLVVAADDGIMPQTREHLAILDLLAVRRGVIAVTKTDRCEAERVASVIRDIEALLATTSLREAPIFAVSNESKAGIPELTEFLHAQFASDEAAAPDLETGHYFRYLIDRSFVARGIGTVLTGSVRAGSVNTGASLLHSANRETCKLRGARLDKTELETVRSPQRAAMNVSLDHKLVSRGDWLLDAAIYCPVQRFDATLSFIDQDFAVRASAQYHLHIGASHHVVNIRLLGENFYQIKCLQPMFAHHGDRFIVRDPASQHTLGGGCVVDIFVPRRRRGGELRLEQLQAMTAEPFAALCKLLEIQADGVRLQEFAVCRNLNDAAIDALCAGLKREGIDHRSLVLQKSSLPVLLHAKYYRDYSANILAQLESHHRQHPNQQGISEPALSHGIDFASSHLLFHSILEGLLDANEIKRSGTLLHLPSHETAMTEEERAFLEQLRPILLKAGFVPPRTRELVEMTNIPLMKLERILRESARAGTLIKVAENRYYLPETIMTLAGFTEELLAADDGEGFSVIQFRDASEIGRNLCIEILEYFDSVGFTRRDGNSRFVRTAKENIFGK